MFIVALGMMAVVPSHAADTAQLAAPSLQQSFDEQLPGEEPQGWKVLWGEQGDDLFTISNLYHNSSQNCALLDRQVGDNPRMYGVGRNLPDITHGWCVISFAMRVEGDGSNVSVGLEIRRKDGQSAGRALSLGLNGLKLNLVSPTQATAILLGNYALEKWYRVSLWLPTLNGKQTAAYAVLEQRTDSGSWAMVGTPQTLAALAPPMGYGVLMLNTAPNKRNFRMFLDDLKVEQRDGEHP